MNKLHFTITVPVHNGAAYLGATLDSLLEQTYPHFEIVILENASTDGTVELIQTYSDPRIRVLPSEKLLAIEDNWARILELEAQAYLLLMCADDLIAPTFLETMVQLIKEHPQGRLFHAWANFINEEGVVTGMLAPVPFIQTAEAFLDEAHQLRQAVFGSGYVMRWEDFKAVAGYPKYPRLLFSDLFCYYALAQKGYKVCAQAFLVSFRVHEKSTGHNASAQEFDEAGRLYIQDLETSGYCLIPERYQSTQRFIKYLAYSAWRVYVHRFIKHPSPRPWEAYLGTLVDLPTEITKVKVYPYDVQFAAYLWLAKLNFRPLRLFLFYLILVWVRTGKFFYYRRQADYYHPDDLAHNLFSPLTINKDSA